jgi:membrane fusion protein, multidrug efflux system
MLQALNKKRCLIIVGILLLSGLLIAIVLIKSSKSKANVEDIPVVRTMTVKSNDLTQAYTYSGEVRGRYESQLAFQVSGKIVRRNVELGSTVQSDDILMEIDAKDLQQTVNSASAQVDSARYNYSLAEINLKRYKELSEAGAASRAEYDKSQTAFDTADATLRQASAQYKQASNQLGYSHLYSNAPGVVSAINAEAGQVVSTGQIVVTVVREGEREIEINVPENRLNEIRKARQIRVALWAVPGASFYGRIREIAPMADKMSRTYKVRVSLVNPPPEIKLGMTASIEMCAVDGQNTAAPYIPLAAVYQTGQSPTVWVVINGQVQLRPIKIGTFADGKIQVLQGLRSGEIIVTAGVHKLRAGQKVNPAGGGI